MALVCASSSARQLGGGSVALKGNASTFCVRAEILLTDPPFLSRDDWTRSCVSSEERSVRPGLLASGRGWCGVVFVKGQ